MLARACRTGLPYLAAALAGCAASSAPSARVDVERIRALMASAGPDTGGAALGIVHRGELIFAAGYGAANLEHRVPITPDTSFYLCSAGKQFTAFAVALLVSEGRLALDDPAQEHVPELAHLAHPVTVRQLIHHTSGLRDASALLAMQGRRSSDLTTHQDALDVILAQRECNFAPGAEHLYSNSGYVLLATIVERVSGTRFAEFMRTRVFAPLGMRRTLVRDAHDVVIPGRATPYERASDGTFRRTIKPYSVYGAGGIYSTVEDLARWLAHLDAPRFGAAAVRMMVEPGVLANGTTLTYSFGLDRTWHRGQEVLGHDGSHAGYRTYVGRVPERDLGVIVLSNMASFDPGAAAFALIDAAPGGGNAAAPAPAAGLDARVLRPCAGRFERVGGGWEIGFDVAGDALVADFAGARTALRPVAADRFWLDVPCTVSGLVTFVREPDGSVQRGTVLGSPVRRVEPGAPWRPGPEDLARYAGRFHSVELDTTYILRVDHDRLVVTLPRHGDRALTPRRPDTFDGPEWFMQRVTFERNPAGGITGLRVTGFRAFNVRFAKG